jgi:hypothetical protein
MMPGRCSKVAVDYNGQAITNAELMANQARHVSYGQLWCTVIGVRLPHFTRVSPLTQPDCYEP